MTPCTHEHTTCSACNKLCAALDCCAKIRDEVIKSDESKIYNVDRSLLCKEHEIDKENVTKWHYHVARDYTQSKSQGEML